MAAAVAAFSVLLSPLVAQAQIIALTGWAWSDTVGWISFNCDATDSCAQYDYAISVVDGGTLSGYAWSDNIGWISANHADVAQCESDYGGGDPQIVNGQFTGWLRAVSGDTNQSGGWDGCISLSGPGYGVTVLNSGMFSGFAWGSDVIGWTDFSLVREEEPAVVYQCPANEYTEDGNCVTSCGAGYTAEGNECVSFGSPLPTGNISARPSLVQSGETTEISWNASNVSSCNVFGDNGDSWSGASGSETSSPIAQQTIYTLVCAGAGGSLRKTATVGTVPSYREL